MDNQIGVVIQRLHADLASSTKSRNKMISHCAIMEGGIDILNEIINNAGTPQELKQYIYQNYMGKVTLDD